MRADVSAVTSGQTSLTLTAGSYSVNGAAGNAASGNTFTETDNDFEF